MRVVLLLIAVHYGTASICPQVNHTVCNSDHPQHACVCGISLKEEAPPEKSCNKLLKIEKNNFPATSVIFKLDEHSDHHDIFPEKKFREAVATSLRIDQENIVLLRVRCVDDDEKLVVQFIVLKDKKSKKRKVHKMIDIEGEPNNTVLVVQTVLAGVAFGMMCILGVWRGLKKKEDLYESVEQKV
ncbi:Uncharacterized protein F13C5.5 [Toxocara canis]|uniref:Uncharacterized protein F13C5.5 n=1 Tax=Toxocara canis TaxID=6265 RepID=A0A0B2VJ69_TOXCA|nr:Uncharacterized protein F13C5.5 [Toxocara canis]